MQGLALHMLELKIWGPPGLVPLRQAGRWVWGGSRPDSRVWWGEGRGRVGPQGRDLGRAGRARQECRVRVWTWLTMCVGSVVANRVNGVPSGGGGCGGPHTPLFETYSDWDREVKRTGASGWRVCSINEGYMVSTW